MLDADAICVNSQFTDTLANKLFYNIFQVVSLKYC